MQSAINTQRLRRVPPQLRGYVTPSASPVKAQGSAQRPMNSPASAASTAVSTTRPNLGWNPGKEVKAEAAAADQRGMKRKASGPMGSPSEKRRNWRPPTPHPKRAIMPMSPLEDIDERERLFSRRMRVPRVGETTVPETDSEDEEERGIEDWIKALPVRA